MQKTYTYDRIRKIVTWTFVTEQRSDDDSAQITNQKFPKLWG